MKYALHGMNTLYSNVVSDVRIAKEAGFDAVEFHTEKLERYLQAGFSGGDLRAVLDKAGLEAAAIDIIGGLEAPDRGGRDELLRSAERLCECARQIGAPTIQLNAFEGLNALSVRQNIEITSANIKAICRLGKDYGIRFQYEGAAWTPIASLEDQLRLIDAVDEANFGLVVDIWHFWACRGAEPEDIAKLDASLIFGVHLCDGKRPAVGGDWPDEKTLRGFLPGQGELPVAEWADAIRQAGFDGFVSGEILNDQLWEADHMELAGDMLAAVKRFL